MPVAAILLAAGASSRFGTPKALLTFAGTTLIEHLARTALAADCTPVIRVLGAHRDAITSTAPASATPGVTDTFNLIWSEGMGNSIACGLRAALDLSPNSAGVIILPCDLPLITADLLRQLSHPLLACSANPTHLALCDYGDQSFGPPAAFGSAHFPALLALTGDQGARTITRTHADKLVTLSFPDGRWDIDSTADWARFHARR